VRNVYRDNGFESVGDGLWRRRFGGDPSVLGRDIQLSGTRFTVIGVMPAGFDPLLEVILRIEPE